MFLFSEGYNQDIIVYNKNIKEIKRFRNDEAIKSACENKLGVGEPHESL